MRRFWISGLCAALLAATTAACDEPKAPDQWTPITLQATPVPLDAGRPSASTAGELTYAGGLQLRSPSALFGGLSGVSVSSDGSRLVAISDTGVWFTADIRLDAAGRLAGLDKPRIAQMRDEAGEPLQGKLQSDAEDLARLPDGRYAVSYEQDHRILIFDLDRKGPFAPATRGPGVGGTKGMHPNEGLEALAALPDGTLVGIAEHAPRGAGSPFWLWPQGAAIASPVGIANRPQGYGISGLAALPTGDLVSVERFYLPFVGVRVNVRLIPASGLAKSPPEADGPVIAALEPPMTLDNMEGIAVAPAANGKVRLYLVSDDNFSANQKTLLLAFDWTPPTPQPGAPSIVAAPAPAVAEAAPPAADAAAPTPAVVPAPIPVAAPVAKTPTAAAAPSAPAPKPAAAAPTPVAKPVDAKPVEPKPAPPKPKPKPPAPKPKPKPVEPAPAPPPAPEPRTSAGPPA